ncbi:flavin monoamine oxidase family protein [Uliginosibacterium paludis]|uniref:FAD-dependent oxidoreductase n=1 Tax=Uliginosibacterium paludis TaxID=1615952 RepID=A0ABV2CT75_9RHOO
MKSSVVIVGGGLAGLTAARHFHQAGIDFQLLEALDRLGGRILSVDASGEMSDDGFDLGPSWFWPGMHSAMSYLVDDLGLPFFAQHSEGDRVFQRLHDEAPRRFPGIRQEPESMRLIGGVGRIISALASELPETRIQLGTRVTNVTLDGPAVEAGFVDAQGTARGLKAAHVLFALPPRVLEASVVFTPALDTATARSWRDMPTWMAPHAKFFALYERAFWRDAGLSGMAQSLVGPLVEIHDATTATGKAALFGFVGVPARQRASAGQDAIIKASISQLACLFGPQANSPSATLYKDWATDPLTATDEDIRAGGHPFSDGLAPVPGEWQNRILLAGSEAGRREPGYLSGAVEAAEYAVLEVLKLLEHTN